MAGTVKGYAPSEIIQGPGDLWVIGTPPSDANVRITLASDGTPDATAHPGSIHLGAMAAAVTTTVKPKLVSITADQFDCPVDAYVSELDAKIDASMAQMEATKLQRAVGVGVYSTGAGYKQVTFGGVLTVPQMCLAVISPTRANPNQYVISLLYLAVATGGFSLALGRAKAADYKASFTGLSDPTRTAGKQIGVVYQTLANASGGTPTAKSTLASEIYQGPADLWLVSPAPTDAAPKVALDGATLTPDSATHGASAGLGLTVGAVTFKLTPKIDFIKVYQFDWPVDAYVATMSASIEAEMSQSAMDKLARALGVGNYTLSAGAFAQCTFGGTNQPPAICVAAIGLKRSDTTKAVVGCLYRVNAQDGITWSASRTKASTYKVLFNGLADVARTAGRTVGIYHEMI